MKVTFNLSFFKLKAIKLSKHLFNNILFQIIILLSTIYVVFSGDVEVYVSEKERLILNDIRTACFFLFIFEFICMNFLESTYFNSIYFYIDLIDIISLITEVHFIWYKILKYLDMQTM